MRNTTFVAYHPPLMQPITIHPDLYFPDDHPHMLVQENGDFALGTWSLPEFGTASTVRGF